MRDDEKVKKEDEGKLLDHNYDGIQELDHHLPRWWLGTLWGTVIFAIFYSVSHFWGSGLDSIEEHERDWAQREFQLKSVPAQASGASEESLAAIVVDQSPQAEGKAVYGPKCASCHGQLGEGGIGPNLTDKFWIHGSKPKDLHTVIEKGVGDKGMPPWGPLLKPTEIESVIAYIHSIQGSNPPNAKAPQGVE